MIFGCYLWRFLLLWWARGCETFAPVASKKIFSGSAIVASHFSITIANLPLSCFLRKKEVFNRILRVLQDAYFCTGSKIWHLTYQSRFCIPKMKLVIFLAMYSKDKSTLLMPLSNFAVMIKQKLFPHTRNPIHVMRTPLYGLRPPFLEALHHLGQFSLFHLSAR